MAENRDFAWLRRTLCDEIEAVRTGKADHARAKSVAALAATALKSVEVEAMLRQQHTDLAKENAPALGSLPLCAAPEEPAPAVAAQEPPAREPQAPKPPTSEPQVEPSCDDTQQTDVSEFDGFKVGDRVMCPNGHKGTIKKIRSSGRIEVHEDRGGTFPYAARYLEALTKPITSPAVPQGPIPRFVAGKDASGSR